MCSENEAARYEARLFFYAASLEPLTRVLKQLAGDGDPPPLAPRDAREKATPDDAVGHVGEAELGHDRRHLPEVKGQGGTFYRLILLRRLPGVTFFLMASSECLCRASWAV